MKISRKTEYAIKTVIDLGLHQKEGLIKASDIAKRQGIPAKFLTHILLDLKTAGVVESRRGLKGGFLLAKPLAEINMANIIMAIETSFNANNYMNAKGDSPFLVTLRDIDTYVFKRLEETTFDDMCEYAVKESKAVMEYTI